MMKATWLWDNSLMVSRGLEIIHFCYRNRVTDLFLQWSLRTPANDYAYFIQNATKFGIRVHACMGEREWYDHSKLPLIGERLSFLEVYQNRPIDQKFVGVHFDIEPHTLPEWKTDNRNIVSSWTDVVNVYTSTVRHMGLEVSCSVPFSIARMTLDRDYAGIGTLAEFMMSQHDKTVIMTYRDFALGSDSIIYHATPFLEQADAKYLDSSVVIAVETKDTTEGDKLTFAQEGKEHMRKQLRKVDSWAREHTSYAGHAIHAVNYWMDLPSIK